MNKFFVTFEASAAYVTNAPNIQALVNGSVISSGLITAHTGAGTSRLTFELEYAAAADFPTSLSFRFSDAYGEARTVTVNRIAINGQDINTTYISMMSLTQGQSSAITIAPADHLFGRLEPVLADIGTPTITGTAGNDTLKGTDGRDVISAGSGNDLINAGAGDNVVSGGAGNDTILGGAGNDLLTGDADNDYIVGGAGDDLLYGGAGTDVLIGGAGNDIMNGGADNDTLFGDAGNDVLYGEGGNDKLFGNAGNDYIYGDDGNDLIDGGAGNDTIYGGTGNDLISGGANNDIIYGEDGNDDIDGGAGDDTIDGGAGIDRIAGGTGNDTLRGGADDDYLTGDAGNDVLYGDSGHDALNGGAGADTLFGGAGNDTLYGHSPSLAEASAIVNGNANVTYNMSTNSFYMVVNTPVNYATALANAQTFMLNGVAGSLVAIGSAIENVYVQSLLNGNPGWLSGSDSVTEGVWIWNGGAEAGSQFAYNTGSVAGMFTNWSPGAGDDGVAQSYARMNANGTWSDATANLTYRYVVEWSGGLFADDNAIDTIYGGDGNDTIYGFGGNDLLYGGAGSDRIWGGAGNDVIYAVMPTVTLFSTNFNATAESFTYADNVFGGTGGAYVSGTRSTTDGVGGNGSLEIVFDGTNATAEGTMSGGWTLNFNAANATPDSILTFQYKVIRAGTYETNEDSFVYVQIDGTYRGLNGNDYVIRYESDGNDLTYDSGWVHVSVNLGALAAGAHTITLGGLVEGKDNANEDTTIRFDNVVLQTHIDSGTNDAHYIDGGNGNDTIYGSAGADILNGGAGDDTIYSQSTASRTVADVLAAYPLLVHNATTKSFYQYVNSTVLWSVANSAAAANVVYGVAGHLAQPNDATENAYLDALPGTNSIWLGGSDGAVNGEWRWVGGPSDGIQFWSGQNGGSAVGGAYASWNTGEPNENSGYESRLEMRNGGVWNDESETATRRYIIEWEDYQILLSGSSTTINGGAGNDTIHGGAGIDIVSGGADNDIIYGGRGGDTLNGDDGDDIIFANENAFDATALIISADYTSTASGGVVQDFFSNTAIPVLIDSNDGTPLEMGMRFQSSVNGYVTGLQFYTGPADNGTHVGHLWTNTGTLLATITVTNETASGWQTMNFSAPVAITAGTTYVISYHSSAGYYSDTLNYFTGPVTNGVITTPAAAGVYNYGASGTFPTLAFSNSNYWVDVLFSQNLPIGGTDGFVYADDALGIGSGSGIYASGSHTASDGRSANGALEIVLGGQNATNVTNIDGGWQLTFNLANSHDNVVLNFSYRMLHPATYEADEDSYVYVKMDGTFYGTGGNNWVARYDDPADPTDSGWVDVSLNLGTLAAGSHTLTLGGVNEKKNAADEETILRFDDISMTGTDTVYAADTAVNTINGGNGNDSLYGAEGNDIITAGAGNDVVYGNGGADTITGGSGNDYLHGGAGNDTITSGSVDTLAAQVAAILAAYPALAYNSTTGSFYQFVNTAVNATTALANAAAATVAGVGGHLVQINSAVENAYIDTLAGANAVWLGINDTGTEGTFRMIGGPMNNINVWIGTAGGTAQNGIYTNWTAGQPDAGTAAQDYVAQANGGGWSDETNGGTNRRYVIEWEGSQLLTPTESTTIVGGAGSDTLYGAAGHDIFLFEAANAFLASDIINNYNAAHLDRLDISDLLTGYTAGVSDVDAFARLTVSGANLLLQVDANGATGGAAYTTIATLNGLGTSNLNVEEMVANNLLIMA